LRFLAACSVLLVLMHFVERDLLELILPLFRWELGVLDDHYKIVQLGLATQGADGVIRLDVTLQRPVFVSGHLVLPDPRGRANVTTLSGNVLQPVIVFLALLVAWPARGWTETAARTCCGLLLLPVLMMVDVPFVLMGELWALLLDRHAPTSFSPVIAWKEFLQGGGRLALAFTAGGLAIVLASRISTGASRKIAAGVQWPNAGPSRNDHIHR